MPRKTNTVTATEKAELVEDVATTKEVEETITETTTEAVKADEVVETVNATELLASIDDAISQLRAAPEYKRVPTAAQAAFEKQMADAYFPIAVPEWKKKQVMSELGSEVTYGQRADLDAVLDLFHEFFHPNDGFKLFIDPLDVKGNGIPLTVVVPGKYSDLAVEDLVALGCHRATVHVPSVHVEQIGVTLKSHFTKMTNILSKYKYPRN